MKPWFNTALILMITVIWIVIGWQLHKRLSHLETLQKIRDVGSIQKLMEKE